MTTRPQRRHATLALIACRSGHAIVFCCLFDFDDDGLVSLRHTGALVHTAAQVHGTCWVKRGLSGETSGAAGALAPGV
jgi:hypothetical protein